MQSCAQRLQSLKPLSNCRSDIRVTADPDPARHQPMSLPVAAQCLSQYVLRLFNFKTQVQQYVNVHHDIYVHHHVDIVVMLLSSRPIFSNS